ncbi:tryptophan synthase alpha subunit [Lipingzhangella halophila]|uniref:Tryptophan synthase alpha subunit n=1 Tax=Lipingzhangella halophila TaxID=1783352 RepID=A0A7W7W4X1_9ACTN|nr:hypothetical protein [Lipingzhangella halophila]MBB4934617.1 tryptophan synthase alpha subunit [Lipingzhangella halophila]
MTDLWAPIDPLIFDGKRIQAAHLIKHQFGYTLQQTIDALGERFQELSRTRPDEFTVPIESYFDNFYT